MAINFNTQEANSKSYSTYTTKKVVRIRNGKKYNWTITTNEIGDNALDNLAKLILKIF